MAENIRTSKRKKLLNLKQKQKARPVVEPTETEPTETEKEAKSAEENAEPVKRNRSKNQQEEKAPNQEN